ncbi:bifunctional DNA primase/polymerase [Streptomyces sp. NPDC060194]|uniref:bifunctional DNA primase/polymerase n=1 Tax=Streptomyces sp. NPDC060194 TaxID=3347069 RepID=UPI003651CE81
MREISGRRRRLQSRRAEARSALGGAALNFATVWRWPVVPGVGLADDGEHRETEAYGGTGADPDGTPRACACPDPHCPVPGAHPLDPPLLAATTDGRMVSWWWSGADGPAAPVLLATGGDAPCAVSLPAEAGHRALDRLDRLGVRLGPVVATPTRWAVLVAPYSLAALGELLWSKDRVPGTLRFHGDGGYLALPPSEAADGEVRWERAPLPGSARPWLPAVEAVMDALLEASNGAPDGGTRVSR